MKFTNLILVLLPILLVAAPLIASGQNAKTEAGLLVETQWLAQNSGSEGLRIIDIGRKPNDYQAGHIPGAAFVDRQAIWDTVGGLRGMLPAAKDVEATLREAGIDNDSTVVIYDSANGLWATRLFWALEYLGHRDVHVLNGGWAKWENDIGDIQTENPAINRGAFTAEVQPDRLATKEWILANLENSGVKVVDTRSLKEYTGQDARSDRGGHIPGAVNIDWVLNVSDDKAKTFLSIPELAELYDSEDISADIEAVTHCQTGVRAAHTYFVLRMLGYEKVRLYDGSWAEWGNEQETPVVTGEALR